MKSFIKALTKEDFITIEEEIIGACFKKSSIIVRKGKEDCVYVTALEGFVDENGNLIYERTKYKFRSFERIEAYNVDFDEGESLINGEFFEWMAKKFGNEYIKAYFCYHTGAALSEMANAK